MSESSFSLTPREEARLTLPNCPGCDTPLEVAGLGLNEETTCPHCGVVILLVRIDGVRMFLRDGWT
ncbi:MAG: hypothetical protein AB7S38_03665 [Vulcanimicrobiota bacterium]